MAIRLLIADDHELVRQGLHAIFQPAGIEVVGEAADCQQAIQLALGVAADVMLLDIRMPGGDGFEVLRALRDATSPAVLIYSIHDRAHHFRRARELGASGYLTKRASRDEVIRAIEAVSRGELYWENCSDGLSWITNGAVQRSAPSLCRGVVCCNTARKE